LVTPIEQAGAAPTQNHVVLNWCEALKQQVPPGVEEMTVAAGARLVTSDGEGR